jgi:uncharacterized membrane protein YozB (DUF420 family)
MSQPAAAGERSARLVIGVASLVVVGAVGALWLGDPPRPAAGGEGSVLPAVNAFLNATSAVLLTVGFLMIRRGQVAAHRACMLSAFGVSALFLVSYVVYHATAGSVPFRGQGWIRPVYFAVLVSHVVLAAVVVPLALTTIHRAWSARFDRHRRIARVALPVWLYVSVTGVLVYLMLHHWAPGP